MILARTVLNLHGIGNDDRVAMSQRDQYPIVLMRKWKLIFAPDGLLRWVCREYGRDSPPRIYVCPLRPDSPPLRREGYVYRDLLYVGTISGVINSRGGDQKKFRHGQRYLKKRGGGENEIEWNRKRRKISLSSACIIVTSIILYLIIILYFIAHTLSHFFITKIILSNLESNKLKSK